MKNKEKLGWLRQTKLVFPRIVYYYFGNIKRHISEESNETKICGLNPVLTGLASLEDTLSVFDIFTLSFHTGNGGSMRK